MSIAQEIEEFADQAGIGLTLCKGFDEAIIAIAAQASKDPVVIYDYEKCVKILMRRDSMTREDACDFMEFNVIGSYVGENTPMFTLKTVDKKGKLNA